MAMQCVESGHLSLDDRIGQYAPGSPDANATVRQLLTHTSGTDVLTFSYRPDRLGVMWDVIRTCTGDSYRGTLINLLDRLAMVDSIPGLDVFSGRLTEGIPSDSDFARYSATRPRVATPYAIDGSKHGTPLQYSATTLTPYSALISSVQDFAQFDLALKGGVLLRSDTIAQMWQTPAGRNGQRLPHGIGWFVQSYSGEPIVWQYGVSDNGTSSLLITAPNRGLTLIMLANSNGLVRPFDLSTGDITVSPFAQLFLGTFVK
jgi:CubicO group peptidase (beta-lactamase class C family)